MSGLTCEVCDKPTGRKLVVCGDCEEELRAALADSSIVREIRGPDAPLARELVTELNYGDGK